MSDPYFQNEGRIGALNPRVRLTAAIAQANTRHPDTDFLIMSGDLIGEGVEDEYKAMAGFFGQVEFQSKPCVRAAEMHH